jgi:predicted membrane metal-binding protein
MKGTDMPRCCTCTTGEIRGMVPQLEQPAADLALLARILSTFVVSGHPQDCLRGMLPLLLLLLLLPKPLITVCCCCCCCCCHKDPCWRCLNSVRSKSTLIRHWYKTGLPRIVGALECSLLMETSLAGLPTMCTGTECPERETGDANWSGP